MFKTFESSKVSTSTQVKASVQRHIRAQVARAHPQITEEQLDALLPKKQKTASSLVQYKVGPHIMLYCRRVEQHEDGDNSNNNSSSSSPTDEPVFFQHRDGPILPTLRVVHKYPTIEFTSVTVDRGAIPFLLGGANCMAPGLTKPGHSYMPSDGEEKDEQGFDKPGLAKGDGVVIRAEGKEHAIGVGVMAMSSAEIREKNKGIAIELAHYLGDGLFQVEEML